MQFSRCVEIRRLNRKIVRLFVMQMMLPDASSIENVTSTFFMLYANGYNLG